MDSDTKQIKFVLIGLFVIISINFYVLFSFIDAQNILETRIEKLEDAQAQVYQMLSSIRFQD